MEMLAALDGNFIPFAAGLAGLGGAIGVGLAGAKGAEAVGRNPGAFGKIFTTALEEKETRHRIWLYFQVFLPPMFTSILKNRIFRFL